MNVNRRQFGGLLAGAAILVVAPAAFAASALNQFKPSGSSTFAHTSFSQLLQQHVSIDGSGYASVNYKSLLVQRTQLEAYVSKLLAFDPSQLSRNEAHAFWINLYNAKTLAIMLEHWPVKSIRDIKLGGGGLFGKGPWSKKLVSINGIDLSLDDIEHRIIRALFQNPLSHYALNCASYSCPNLMPVAYTGENLISQVRESAVMYVNHPRGLTIRDGKITASKIYSWYAGDFGGEEKLKQHWLEFAKPELAAQIQDASIGSYTYDWSANVAR